MFSPFTIIAVIAILIIVFAVRSHKRGSPSAEGELLRLCRGDREQVDRLIAHERNRDSNISREKAIKDAIRSLRRDKG